MPGAPQDAVLQSLGIQWSKLVRTLAWKYHQIVSHLSQHVLPAANRHGQGQPEILANAQFDHALVVPDSIDAAIELPLPFQHHGYVFIVQTFVKTGVGLSYARALLGGNTGHEEIHHDVHPSGFDRECVGPYFGTRSGAGEIARYPPTTGAVQPQLDY
jgi:hypothetical protein